MIAIDYWQIDFNTPRKQFVGTSKLLCEHCASLHQRISNHDCVGAIDGILVDAWVPASRQNTFCGRKSTVS
ncbi:hypothetical protein ACSBR1_023425 [Camellia fascicularis]